MDQQTAEERFQAFHVNTGDEKAKDEPTQNALVPASIVPDRDIVEQEGLDNQHQKFRTLTEILLAGVAADVRDGKRVGCLVRVGTHYCPAEILGDETRFDSSVDADCHFVQMRRINGEDVEHKITRRTIMIMEPYAQQIEGEATPALVSPPVTSPASTTSHGQPPRMVKVAPGDGARLWQECVTGGYICIGWDGFGDLRQYPDQETFKTAFAQTNPYTNKYDEPNKGLITKKGNEIWTFFTLQPGDLVAANDGVSKILGVGTVIEPAYEWRPERSEYRHLVHVQWDMSLARTIPKQSNWPFVTIEVLDVELTQLILSGAPIPPAPLPGPTQTPSTPMTTPLIPSPSDVMSDYQEPDFSQIEADITSHGLRLDDGLLRRYHLALKTRGFVILSGISGTGKTWLAEAYAQAVGAETSLVPVAPNWTTNEDLLGYLNPLSGQYHDTDFSRFLRRASYEYHRAQDAGQTPVPFHVILDEMNLARVEYYFAKFLSLMEQRARHGHIRMDLGDEPITLPPNLVFIGTVNIDETTHGFADKVYDRAQLLELTAPRQALAVHIGDTPHRDALLNVWDAVAPVAPFAFRVVDEIRTYLADAASLGVPWQEALDEQLLQKVLPKLKGTDLRLGLALRQIAALTATDFPRTAAKAAVMSQGFSQHGFASFF